MCNKQVLTCLVCVVIKWGCRYSDGLIKQREERRALQWSKLIGEGNPKVRGWESEIKKDKETTVPTICRYSDGLIKRREERRGATMVKTYRWGEPKSERLRESGIKKESGNCTYDMQVQWWADQTKGGAAGVLHRWGVEEKIVQLIANSETNVRETTRVRERWGA